MLGWNLKPRAQLDDQSNRSLTISEKSDEKSDVTLSLGKEDGVVTPASSEATSANESLAENSTLQRQRSTSQGTCIQVCSMYMYMYMHVHVLFMYVSLFDSLLKH